MHGPARASIRDIAQHAGVAPGLVRHYYGNKEGLTRAVDDSIMELIATTLEAVPLEGARHEISEARDRAFSQLLEEHPLVVAYVRQMFVQPSSPDEETLLDRLVDLTLAQTEHLIAQGLQPRKGVRDSVYGTVVRQVVRLVLEPTAARVWRRLGEALPEDSGGATPPAPLSVRLQGTRARTSQGAQRTGDAVGGNP